MASDDKIVSCMPAHDGAEEPGPLRDLYAVDVSPDLISRVGVHWKPAIHDLLPGPLAD